MSVLVLRKERKFVISSLRSSEIRIEIPVGIKGRVKFSRLVNLYASLVVASNFLKFRCIVGECQFMN